MKGAENYGFLRKLLETIKQTEDALEPDMAEASKVRRMGRKKESGREIKKGKGRGGGGERGGGGGGGGGRGRRRRRRRRGGEGEKMKGGRGR